MNVYSIENIFMDSVQITNTALASVTNYIYYIVFIILSWSQMINLRKNVIILTTTHHLYLIIYLSNKKLDYIFKIYPQ